MLWDPPITRYTDHPVAKVLILIFPGHLRLTIEDPSPLISRVKDGILVLSCLSPSHHHGFVENPESRHNHLEVALCPLNHPEPWLLHESQQSPAAVSSTQISSVAMAGGSLGRLQPLLFSWLTEGVMPFFSWFQDGWTNQLIQIAGLKTDHLPKTRFIESMPLPFHRPLHVKHPKTHWKTPTQKVLNQQFSRIPNHAPKHQVPFLPRVRMKAKMLEITTNKNLSQIQTPRSSRY